jgi:hypothetical protein
MRRLLVAIGAVAVLGAMAMPALAQAPDKLNVFLYVDTVNGSRPAAGTKPRPIGCTQSNNWRRGEQVVFRVWGSVADTGAILNTENVKYAYVSIPGQANMKLNWGAHGAQTNRVWFWTSAWIVPADYPLGSLKARIVFKTEENKFGRYDYDMNIIPTAKAKAKKKR